MFGKFNFLFVLPMKIWKQLPPNVGIEKVSLTAQMTQNKKSMLEIGLMSSLFYLFCGEDQLNDDVTLWLLPSTEYWVGTYYI